MRPETVAKHMDLSPALTHKMLQKLRLHGFLVLLSGPLRPVSEAATPIWQLSMPIDYEPAWTRETPLNRNGRPRQPLVETTTTTTTTTTRTVEIYRDNPKRVELVARMRRATTPTRED